MIVTDGRTLRGMEAKGFIVYPALTEKHWTGYRVKSKWVQPGPRLEKTYQTFEYRGAEYQLRYLDGCFHPFVWKVGTSLPGFA